MFTALFFFGNTLYVLSYSVRSMIWLRILSILAASLAIPYFLFRETSDWSAILWQSLYILVNTINLIDLVIKMRPFKLTQEEQFLQEGVLKTLSSSQIRNLVNKGTWQSYDSGEKLISFNQPVDKLILITQGNADARIEGTSVMTVKGGDFIGEMSFLTGNAASADVVAGQNLRALAWKQDELKAYLTKESKVDALLQGILSSNVVKKLNQHAIEKAGLL